MSVETETMLIKLLEELKVEVKQINQSLTNIQVNQARLEGEVKTVQVEVQNVKEDVRDIKTSEKWLIGLFVTLIGLIGTVLIRLFNLLPS